MKHTVTVHGGNVSKAFETDSGTNLLSFLRSHKIHIETPCGGKGTCGKCAVRVRGSMEEPTEDEKLLLGFGKSGRGYRLACRTAVVSDIDVYLEDTTEAEASVITGATLRHAALAPIVTKQYVELPEPSLENQLPDVERVLAASRTPLDFCNVRLLREIPGILRGSAFKVTLVVLDGKLAAVEPGNTESRLFGAAFDIGTTTVAAYLYNLAVGECIAVSSALNPQRKYGADVISRISYTMESKDARNEMQTLIADCVNELLSRLADRAGINNHDIYVSVFAGNTTMMHMLTGLDATGIATSPFIPVVNDMLMVEPTSLGLNMNSNGAAIIFPGVSAYVGADTVAAILSSGLYEDEDVSLLVDIGTNGEMVLGCSDWMIACSTAAGPAFEGANIRCGVGGVMGAIDTVGPAPEFRYTTIGNTGPVGICGSGIIDAVASLLDCGLIDETGRMADEEEAAELGSVYANRLTFVDGMRAFRLAAGDDNRTGTQVIITQKDIRELQNAKAAIAAGIETMIKHSGISKDDVKRVYLAGGFGSSLNIDSALKIGLLPCEFRGRIAAVGNASGAGASEGLLSKDMLKAARQIKHNVKYLELSALAEFTEKYVQNMLFEKEF